MSVKLIKLILNLNLIMILGNKNLGDDRAESLGERNFKSIKSIIYLAKIIKYHKIKTTNHFEIDFLWKIYS